MGDVLYTVILCVCALLGYMVGQCLCKRKATGMIFIDTEDPSKDKWYFEFKEDPDKAIKRGYMIFKVAMKGETPKWPNE